MMSVFGVVLTGASGIACADAVIAPSKRAAAINVRMILSP
jgi:hypothetical protein